MPPKTRWRRLLRGESWRNIINGMADGSDVRYIFSDDLVSMVRLNFLASIM